MVITKHPKNSFETNELAEGSVCANFAHTTEYGKTYSTKYDNLKAIIAVDYTRSGIILFKPLDLIPYRV
jgi:hypothetical protein